MYHGIRTLLLVPLVAAACSGNGNIETVPGPVYLVAVENPMSHPMDVWYDDGVETVELGRVAAGEVREFVIAGPADTTVEIVARDDDRTHTVTRAAQLTRPGTARVVLTP